MRQLISNNQGSAIPVILFLVTLIGCGALYTLLFLEVAQPNFEHLIPDSDSKTFIMMLIYAVPLMILIVGVISLLQAGLKRQNMYGGV